MAKESVLIVCAHPDDEVFGVGGTIARYVAEGKHVMVVHFSYGEKSHIWLKQRYTSAMREKEATDAQNVLGYADSLFLGIEEGKFSELAKGIKADLKRIIQKNKPVKIFTHNIEDPHHDHKEVHRIVLQSVEELECGADVYMFDIWNLFDFRRLSYPRMYVDITDTFRQKIEALSCFKSQWSTMIILLWSVYVRAIAAGFAHHVRFAEGFYKIR